jgi:hypothetical protein
MEMQESLDNLSLKRTIKGMYIRTWFRYNPKNIKISELNSDINKLDAMPSFKKGE